MFLLKSNQYLNRIINFYNQIKIIFNLRQELNNNFSKLNLLNKYKI